MATPVKVGVIGCGKISGAYFKMAAQIPVLDIVAVSDLDLDRARAAADEYGFPKACTSAELMADELVEVVLNLTVPKAHAPVAIEALEAGKHTFAEKPYGVNRDEGRRVLELAAAKGLRTGCAPDTFLGAGVQTARELIDQGVIGQPVAFTAFMMSRGHETWHPSPEFYYEVGGGPMFDMGPYYLTALLQYLGPVKRISGMASIAIPERTITSEPKRGKTITVETPDHICGLMEFENGCTGTIIQTFATYHGQSGTTIYGTEGTIRCPNPNAFDDKVLLRLAGDEEWREVEHTFPTGYGRAVGLADLATALASGRPHRCSGEQAYYVLDLMQGFLDASASGASYTPEQSYQRPAPMAKGLSFGVLDD